MSPNNNHFDLIVLGTGPAAATVAIKAARDGHRVAVAEAKEPGGTCALRGCNPKKVYTEGATMVAQACHGRERLINRPEILLNWEELHRFKNEFTEDVPSSTTSKFKDLGIRLFTGKGSFISPSHIEVGDQTLEGQKIFIGTGARPRPLDIDGTRLVTRSEEFFNLKQLPESIAFIGGGYISMEFAHVAARAGAQVTIIHQGTRVLEGFDPDLVNQLMKYSQHEGISIHCNANVTKVIDVNSGNLQVVYEHSGKEHALTTQLVVHGAGRVPAIRDLNLDQGKVQFEATGVVVDEFLRSPTNPRVFAAGDCAATKVPKLTPCATEEARVVSENLFAENPSQQPQYGSVPKAAFTVPPIASVGMSEEDAANGDAEYEVHQDDMSQWGTNRKIGPACAGYKVITASNSNRILGAHLLGPSASETINLFSMAIAHDITARQLKGTLFVFPTHAAEVRKMI